jgi:hypothetical protein
MGLSPANQRRGAVGQRHLRLLRRDEMNVSVDPTSRQDQMRA